MLVEKNYKKGTEADKSAYKKQLVEYLDRLDKIREEGWLTDRVYFSEFGPSNGSVAPQGQTQMSPHIVSGGPY